MKPQFVAAVTAAALFALQPQNALAVDKFGQNISAEIEKKVLESRELRIPTKKTKKQAQADARRAIRMLEDVVKGQPTYYRAWFNLALAQNLAGDYDKARESFDKAIEIRESEKIEDITIFNTAGWAALNAGDYDKAESYLSRALSGIETGSRYTQSAIYHNLGKVYFLTNRRDRAEEYLRKSIDIQPSQESQVILDIISKSKSISKARTLSRKKK